MRRRVLAATFLSVALGLSACSGSGGSTTAGAPETTTVAVAETLAQTSFAKFKSMQAVNAFKRAGLEAEGARPTTREDYGLAPLLASEGTRFLIPSLGADVGGRVFSFTKPDDMAKMKAFYDDLGKGSAALFSHTFVKDNLLVQINGALKDADAIKYHASLQGLK